jgi:spermidine/putrescine transport system permease protein
VAAAMTPLARTLWAVIGGLFVFFLLSPLALVVLFSFSDKTLMNFPIEGLSLHWWQAMVDNPKFWPAFENSIIVAVVVGAASAVIGTMAALGFARLPARRSSTAIAILCLPLMLPPLVLAVSLLSFYVSVGFRLNLVTVILSQLLFTQPFVVMVVYARMLTFDWRVVESARDLGAPPLTAFRTVTLPIIQPTVIGAALIAVALSIDDFIITFFTIGSGNTMPTFVWGMIRTSLTPTVNAIGTLIILITISSTLTGLWLTRYRG